MEWNYLTTKQRILWVTLLVCSVVAVGVLGVMIYQQLVGEEVTVHTWCTITFAICSIVNAFFALTHSKKTSES